MGKTINKSREKQGELIKGKTMPTITQAMIGDQESRIDYILRRLKVSDQDAVELTIALYSGDPTIATIWGEIKDLNRDWELMNRKIETLSNMLAVKARRQLRARYLYHKTHNEGGSNK